MTLTKDDLAVLKAPFELSEHEFLSGATYIKEHPITNRIEEVDPAWQYEVKSITVRDNAGKDGKDVATVTVHASLTIKGVTRDGVGMAVVQKSFPKDNKKTGEQYTIEANEAEKSAATDALKRAARLFGIGRYLLLLTGVKNESDLKNWLKKNYGPTGGNGSRPKEKFTTPTNVIVTKKGDNDQPYMVAEECKFLSREPFSLLDYGEDVIKALGEYGVTELEDTVTIVYVQDGDDKNPLRVRRDSTGEIVDVKANELLKEAS